MKLSSTIYTCITTKNVYALNEIRNLNDETANWRKNDNKKIVSVRGERQNEMYRILSSTYCALCAVCVYRALYLWTCFIHTVIANVCACVATHINVYFVYYTHSTHWKKEKYLCIIHFYSIHLNCHAFKCAHTNTEPRMYSWLLCSLPIVTMQQIIIFFKFLCDCAILSIVNADPTHTHIAHTHSHIHTCI